MKGSYAVRIILAFLAIALVAGASVPARPSLAAARTGDRCQPEPGQGEPSGAAAPPAGPPGPGFYSQSSNLFRPLDVDDSWDFHAGRSLYNPGDTGGEYGAPVSLPHGATVTRLVVYYQAIVDPGVFQVKLERIPLAGPYAQESMAYISPPLHVGSYWQAEDTSISFAEIDLQNYSYRVYAYIPGGKSTSVLLKNFSIDYDYPGYAPSLLKKAP